MTLDTGIYIISCKSTESYIGRNRVKDDSLLPKRIITLPQGVEAPRFFVEKSPIREGGYTIRAMDGLVTKKDDLLWAFLIHSVAPPTSTWLINQQVQHGERIYTAEKPNHLGSWIVPDKAPETQVAVKPLITTRSLPPQYQPQALFEFVRIDREE